MRVAMIGSGYVGLVSGACFADFGHVVTCVDKDPAKIDALLAGVMPIYEPGLANLVANNVREGRLSFTTEFAELGSATRMQCSSRSAHHRGVATGTRTSPTSIRRHAKSRACSTVIR